MNVYLWTNEIDPNTLGSLDIEWIYNGTDEVWTSAPLPNYLCFTANTAWSTLQLTQTWTPTAVTLETSIDWKSWNTYTFWDTITLANIWDKVYWRNTSETDTEFSTSNYNYYKFEMTGSIAWSGDINFLLNKNSTTTLSSSFCYIFMFNWCTWLTTAPELPATTLTDYCYSDMFKWCTWLTEAPALPATTLITRCYYNMFNWCTWLTSAPALPATTLASYCYNDMFYWCTWLTSAPVLPATTLAERCYSYMFSWCTWLTSTPALPATALANYCYNYMFEWCTWLTTASALPATTLFNRCYYSMFRWCTWLTSIPALPATKLANNCYYSMFQWCSKIKLSTTKTWEYQTAYRIPTSGTWSWGSNQTTDMFKSTGWTFTGTPSINTTYYTSNTVVS